VLITPPPAPPAAGKALELAFTLLYSLEVRAASPQGGAGGDRMATGAPPAQP
jgi:hypothetical protein